VPFSSVLVAYSFKSQGPRGRHRLSDIEAIQSPNWLDLLVRSLLLHSCNHKMVHNVVITCYFRIPATLTYWVIQKGEKFLALGRIFIILKST